jgi:hypothetical protein
MMQCAGAVSGHLQRVPVLFLSEPLHRLYPGILFAENRSGHLQQDFKPLYDHYSTNKYFDGRHLFGTCLMHLFPQMSRYLLQGPLKPLFADYVERLKRLIKWDTYALRVGVQYRYFADLKKKHDIAQLRLFARKCADELARVIRTLNIPAERVVVWLASDNLRDMEEHWARATNGRWSVFHLASPQLQPLGLSNPYDFVHTAQGPAASLFLHNLKPMLDFHMTGELDVLFSTGTTFATIGFLRTPLTSSTVGFRTYYQGQRGDQEMADPVLIFG